MSNLTSFNVVYDRDADVLYFSAKTVPASRSVMDDRGILWRFDADGLLIGATIMDFDEFWRTRHVELAAQLSRKFDLPAKQTKAILDHAAAK